MEEKNHHENIYEHELHHEEKPSKLKKYFILTIGILMIILMLSYLLPLEKIGSSIISKKIKENRINMGNYSVYFSNDVYNELVQKFAISDKEFKACLMGEINDNGYVIDSLYYPEIISSSFVEVTSVICNSSTLISLHSHPSLFCIFSGQDIKSYDRIKEINSKAIIGLMCDIDRFNFYSG